MGREQRGYRRRASFWTPSNLPRQILTDGPFRERVTASARQLVEAEFSLQAMGRAYDELVARMSLLTHSSAPEAV